MSKGPAGVVVAGAGAAGHGAATTLRRGGYAGAITVVHAERHAPYNRILVNKAVLQGVLTAEQIALPSLESLDVEVVHGTAGAVDAETSALVLADGRRLPYDALVAATGSRPRGGHLSTSGRVLHVHTVDDAARLRGWLGTAGDASVVLLGAGFIGGETASYLAETGIKVHLVSRPTVPLEFALGERIARRAAELHREHVITHFGREEVGIAEEESSVTVTLDDGQHLTAHVAVVAQGTVPCSWWLTGVDDGLLVDDRLRVADRPRVYAAGSVAVHTARTGQRYRVDHWDAAASQGAHVARTLLHDLFGGDDPGPYVPMTGFSLMLYGHAIAAYGVSLPGALQRERDTVADGGALTTFHDPADERLVAAAGFAAGRDLLALRGQIQRP